MMSWVEIGTAVEITNKRVKPFKGERQYLATGDLSVDGVDGLVAVDYELKPSRADLLVDEGDLVVARMKATNKVLLIDNAASDFIVSTGFLTLKPKQEFDARYLYHYFRSSNFQTQKDRYCSGATQKAINNSAFYELKAPKYSLTRQVEIAGAFDVVEKLGQKRKQSLQLLNDFLRATFIEMFGDPVRKDKDWTEVALQDVADVHRGRFSPRPRNDPSYYGGEYPFIQTGDISNSNYRLRFWSQTLNEKGIKVSRQFNKGTIVIAIVGATIGATAILEIDTYAPDSVVGIAVDEKKVTNRFIEYLLRFYRPIFVARAPETARANINLETLRPLKIPLPPIGLQNQFSEIMVKAEFIIDLQRKSAQEIDIQFNALMQRYFG